MAGLKAWHTAVLVLAAALFLGVTPMTVYNATLVMLGNSCGWAWQTVRAVPPPTPPLKAAILNVTSDFDQLAHLLAEFMSQPGMDPGVEQHFVEFLSQRATRSYPRLESMLDWLLAIYKFVFPFLIISMVAKMSGGQEGGEAAKPAQPDRGAAAEERGLPPALERQLSRRASQQQQLLQQQQPDALYAGINGLVDPFTQQHQQQRRPLAINGSMGRAAKGGGGGSSSGGAADRGGSLSPRGPETPMEGSASRLLPQHPAAAAGATKAWQRPAVTEITADGF